MPAQGQVKSIFGGNKLLGHKVSSLADFDQLVREGFSWEAVAHAKDALEISDEEFALLLGISPRTLARKRKDKTRLNLSASDRLYRLVRIVSLASEVLEGLQPALSWLSTPQIGLGGRAPLDLIRTEVGTRQVEDLLGRMEYGVLS